MKPSQKGYTLVELILAMLIFSVVMLIISVSFSGIVKNSGQLLKSAETDIGGLIGLEVMRSDLELAGFGLPYTVPSGIVYSEAKDDLKVVGNCPDGCPQAKPSLYDDRSNPDDPQTPSPYRLGNNVGFNGSDYLALKGSALAMSGVSRSWCYLNYSSNGVVVKRPPGESELLSGKGNRVIVLRSGVAGGAATRELVADGTSFTLTFNEPLDKEFAPRDRGDSHLVYGIAADEDGLSLSFPFNRADYYLSRPESSRFSKSCAPGTGVLYKSNINQGGGHTPCPILDCAADLQVVLSWDTSGDGQVDYHSESLEEVAKRPADLRATLKELRVYILAQQGKLDTGYLHPVTDPERSIVVGDPALAGADGVPLGRVWKASELAATFGQKWRNYRWKLYTIVVQPKNL